MIKILERFNRYDINLAISDLEIKKMHNFILNDVSIKISEKIVTEFLKENKDILMKQLKDDLNKGRFVNLASNVITKKIESFLK